MYRLKKKKLKPRVSETQTLMVESLVGMRVGEENGSTNDVGMWVKRATHVFRS